MGKVWVIESGSHSEYTIDGIFSSRENAEYIFNLIPKKGFRNAADDPRINELVLDPGVEEIRNGKTMYFIQMGFNGDIISLCKSEEVFEKKLCVYSPADTQKMCEGVIWANSHADAMRITNEFRCNEFELVTNEKEQD